MKIVDNKINWVCLKEKCPKNCCKSFISNNTSLKYEIKNNEIPLMTGEEEKLSLSKVSPDRNHYIDINNDSSCPYLKTGKCSVYDDRPSYCRSYPFYIDLSCGLSIDKQCPGLGAGWTSINELRGELNNTIKIYDFWISQINNEVK